MASAIKMDELLVSWLGSDSVYENVLSLIDQYRAAEAAKQQEAGSTTSPPSSPKSSGKTPADRKDDEPDSPRGVIPPFYPIFTKAGKKRRRRTAPQQCDTWEPLPPAERQLPVVPKSSTTTPEGEDPDEDAQAQLQAQQQQQQPCVRDQVLAIYAEHGQDVVDGPIDADEDAEFRKFLTLEAFVRITKEVCRFPSFFNGPLYSRILETWNEAHKDAKEMQVVTLSMFHWYWHLEMEPFDAPERFFRLIKQPQNDFIVRDDFLPFIKALLNDHPGLEFLAHHAEFQEKYAVTVITRIFYCVNKCHSGRITSRQLRRSDLLEAFSMVDEEEDINKVTKYFSYEHFYVLYCRFWELDHDRDYRITREDLLKYGDHSLSHMIVDRIFDAAPRPFEQERVQRDFLSYEDFIYFMLSEEDKANDVSVRYWFTCVDVDGDGKLNNMEMRSFYAVQLHRMQCMGHEIVPFEDMLCQMMDMIKPSNPDFLIAEDFLQPECSQVSGALFDALFNLNKYLMFEQRDPFVERQKREDEFETDWDRFACIDYNRLAMEEEAREEEAMEIDWVTVDDEDDDGDGSGGANGVVAGEEYLQAGGPGSSEAPF